MTVAHISGHLDVTQEEFREHYEPRINEAIAAGHNFVVGDARGADYMAQVYLSVNCDKNKVVVYHMFTKPLHYYGGFATQGGYTNHTQRDAAMTAASDYDIAWVRPGKENSGTARNLKRRHETNNS